MARPKKAIGEESVKISAYPAAGLDARARQYMAENNVSYKDLTNVALDDFLRTRGY